MLDQVCVWTLLVGLPHLGSPWFMTTSSPAAVVGSVGVAVGLIDGEGCTDGSDCTDDSDCTGDWLGTGTGSARVAGMRVPVFGSWLDVGCGAGSCAADSGLGSS